MTVSRMALGQTTNLLAITQTLQGSLGDLTVSILARQLMSLIIGALTMQTPMTS